MGQSPHALDGLSSERDKCWTYNTYGPANSIDSISGVLGGERDSKSQLTLIQYMIMESVANFFSLSFLSPVACIMEKQVVGFDNSVVERWNVDNLIGAGPNPNRLSSRRASVPFTRFNCRGHGPGPSTWFNLSSECDGPIDILTRTIRTFTYRHNSEPSCIKGFLVLALVSLLSSLFLFSSFQLPFHSLCKIRSYTHVLTFPAAIIFPIHHYMYL